MEYKDAGVDIDAGEFFVQMIRERVRKAWPNAGEEIGGFAGGGPIPAGARRIISSSDGTGTKAILAAAIEMLGGLGQDAAAMSIVDSYVSGARPFYLLDVLDVAKLVPKLHIKIIESIIQGCLLSGCRLIGGETAELPDMFKSDWMVNLNTTVIAFPDPDLAFVPVRPGQLAYGWPSYGPAANGFSLIRKIFRLNDAYEKPSKNLRQAWPELGNITLADAILRPTPIWITQIETQRKRGVKFSGHTHITGGGMPGNIPRILPDNLKVIIQRDKWPRPPIFPLTQREGNVPPDDMDKTFNQGIMVVSIVDQKQGPKIDSQEVFLIGEVTNRKPGEPQVTFHGSYRD